MENAMFVINGVESWKGLAWRRFGDILYGGLVVTTISVKW